MSAPIGNKFAAKAKECEQALKRAMAREFDGDWRKGLDAIASKVVKLAYETGDKWATDTVFDRIDGRPAQSLEVTGDITNRNVSERSDTDLEGILSAPEAGSEGVVNQTQGSPVTH